VLTATSIWAVVQIATARHRRPPAAAAGEKTASTNIGAFVRPAARTR
jgi:hypothetical protein